MLHNPILCLKTYFGGHNFFFVDITAKFWSFKFETNTQTVLEQGQYFKKAHPPVTKQVQESQ